MKQNEFKPFKYSKSDWEKNPKWLFDAYRKVAFQQQDSSDPNAYKRFIEYLAKTEELTDSAKIGIFTDDKHNLVVGSGYYAEKVVAPFMPLIEAVTDEMLELGKIVGHDYMDVMVKEASIILQKGMQQHISDAGRPTKASAEEWALREIRIQLRNKVAAAMFKGIREYALAEYTHREHLISDLQYEQALEKIESSLNKSGINGLGPFLKTNSTVEEMLQTDDRTFVPYNYKMADKQSGEVNPTWFPNDREQKQFKRSDYYNWQMTELEEKQGNPPFPDWNYEEARLSALYNIMGPNYCEAVKQRNSVASKLSLGNGGKSSSQAQHNHAIHLGYDLSNEELRHLMETGGTKDLSGNEAEVIHNVNNLLGSLDARLKKDTQAPLPEQQGDSLDQNKKKTSEAGLEKSSDKGHQKDDSADIRKSQRDRQGSPRPNQNPTNNPDSVPSDTTGADSGGEKKSESKQNNTALGIKVGSAALGSILVADQLRRANKKTSDADGVGHDSDEVTKKEKSTKMVNYIIASLATVGVAAVIFTKPEKLVKFTDSISKFFGGGKGKI